MFGPALAGIRLGLGRSLEDDRAIGVARALADLDQRRVLGVGPMAFDIALRSGW